MKTLKIILAIAVLGVAARYLTSPAHRAASLHKDLARAADEVNQKLPARLDAVTTADKVVVEGSTVRITYLIDDAAQFRSVDLAAANTRARQAICGSELKRLLQHQATLQVRFRWNDSGVAQQRDIDVPPGTCA